MGNAGRQNSCLNRLSRTPPAPSFSTASEETRGTSTKVSPELESVSDPRRSPSSNGAATLYGRETFLSRAEASLRRSRMWSEPSMTGCTLARTPPETSTGGRAESATGTSAQLVKA